MIDWSLTQQAFGVAGPDGLVGKRPKIICRCDGCNKPKEISVRVKSRIVNGQMPFRCPSCVAISRSEQICDQMLNRWRDENYRTARKNASIELWKNEDYRVTHSASVKDAMSRVDMKSVLQKRYSDQEQRERLKAASRNAWNNGNLRSKHAASMNRPETKKKLSDAARAHWKTHDFRLKMAAVRSRMSKNISSIQLKLYKLLDDLEVNYEKESDKTKFGYYVFDCLVPHANLLIECHGDYWHGLDRAQTRDRQKFTYMQRYFPNYRLAYIWEREFYQPDRVLNRLKSLLKIDMNIVDFDFKNIEVRPVDSVKDFLELYHYLGPGRGGSRIGAYLGDVLVAVAVFSTHLRQNLTFEKDSLECSRFCIHPKYQKKNFASWFLTKCAKFFPNRQLFSYADTTVGHSGVIYKAAGWRHHHTVAADYWYMDKDGFVMHKKTLYNRAINLKLTEAEFANKYEYQKIFGGQKECFVHKYVK